LPKKRIVLTFPPFLVDQPITYHLIKDYGLTVNILKARVTPKEEGRLVLEASGKRRDLNRGIEYLKELGVAIRPLAQDIKWDRARCFHCTLCVAICPAKAFVLDRERWEVSFQKERCIACEICIDACPYRAIEIYF
jgi:formate hydrogenlyase subunit 6/NADH:ubiquinone oxidoreductase subunit I